MRGLDGDRRLRDLYDVYAVLNARDLDFNLLQQTFLAAGAESQKDWSQETPRGLYYNATFGYLLVRDARAFIDRLRTYAGTRTMA